MIERVFDLTLDDEKKLDAIVQALNASVRRKIMSLLRDNCYSIAELAKVFKLPVSTVSFHINILRKAGFISITVKKNSRGNAKLIARRIDRFSLDFFATAEQKSHTKQEIINIPLGSFSDASIGDRCGMASEESIIGFDDLPGIFYSPERLKAQIIWFSKGYIEYRIPNYMIKDKAVSAISFSLELCSEAPNYRNDWKSDITFWVNGVELVTYVSPGDFGGRRGRLNPEWWSDYSSQYGIVKTVRITEDCVYLDEMPVHTYTIDKLGMKSGDYVTLRIGIKPDAKNQGGINIFGEKFGDFPQGIVCLIDYK